MFLDLKPLFSGDDQAIRFSHNLDFSYVEIWGCRPFVESVGVTGKAFCRAGIVLLEYNAQFILHVSCGRCLEEFARPYDMDFTSTVVRKLSGEDEGDFLVAENDRLDLEKVVLDDILLELPIKWICGEDCKGLCPKCGANRNKIQCSCDFSEPDPRLAALRQLLEQ